MKTEYKHISFEKKKVPASRKTEEWTCRNKSGEYLGCVAWYSPWRQYCWHQETHIPVVMARSCLNDISDFIRQLMEAWKKPV
jgi:hypothetical protein